MHPTSRSLRAHQSRRDHRALFRPETGSRSFAGSWDPRLGPLLSNDRGHLPEARMLLGERKFHDKVLPPAPRATEERHGRTQPAFAPRSPTSGQSTPYAHARLCSHAPHSNNVGSSIKVCQFCEALRALPHSQAAATKSLQCAKCTMLRYIVKEAGE